MATPKKDGMAALIASATKKYSMSVGTLADIGVDTKFISTGNLAIDLAIGNSVDGGIPMGRTVELFGPPSSGKTTLAAQAAANLQKIIKAGGDPSRGIGPDDYILYLDYEQAFDPAYAVALGLDPDHKSFLFSQPDTLEDGANFLLDSFRTGEVRLGLVDSLAAMTPSAKMEAEIGKSLPAVQAKLLKDLGMNLNSVLANNNGTVIFINHEMDVMEMGGYRRPGMPAPTTTPGGKATKFFASVRVQFRHIRSNKGEVIDPITNEKIEIPVSNDVKVKVVKNKVAPPFREATVRVRFGLGFDQFWTAMQVMLAAKKVIYGSGRYYFHNCIEDVPADWMDREKTGTQRPYIHGEKALLKRADIYPDWRAGIIDLAEQVARENVEALGKVAQFGVSVDEDDEGGVSSDELDELIEASETGNRISL